LKGKVGESSSSRELTEGWDVGAEDLLKAILEQLG